MPVWLIPTVRGPLHWTCSARMGGCMRLAFPNGGCYKRGDRWRSISRTDA